MYQNDWARYLMWAEYTQNSICKEATGLNPFQCVLGYQPPLFPWSGEPTNVPAVNDWLNRSEFHDSLLRPLEGTFTRILTHTDRYTYTFTTFP